MHTLWATIGRWLWRIRRFFHPTVMTIAPGYEGYGGATITRRFDGAGAEWIACCARQQSDGYFGFFAFRNGVNVPLSPRVSGRGSIHDDGLWIAWEGSTAHKGTLPGWTPIPKGDTSALQAQIDALETEIDALADTVAHIPPTTTAYPLYIPAQPGMPVEGGELQLADGAGGRWSIDCRNGNLRFMHNGIEAEHWPK